MDKLKVIWICHFSNKQVQSILKPKKAVGDFAPWIDLLVNSFKGQTGVELYVIAPHEYIRGIRKLDIEGVHYTFFNPYIPFSGRHWPWFFRADYATDFFYNKLVVRSIVRSIKPDIIHLHGAENPYYSSTILQFYRKYPVLVTIQGIISHAPDHSPYIMKRRVAIEQKVMQTFCDFGVRTEKMARDVQLINPRARLHWHNYGIRMIAQRQVIPDYDLVYFGVVNAYKGVDVLIKALYIVKKYKPDVHLKIIGSGAASFISEQQSIARDLGVDGNITWLPYFPTQDAAHRVVEKAKIAVLPSRIDIIPGTIIESMMLGVPVISTKAGSIPELDNTGSAIALVEPGNHVALANEIVHMLSNDEYRESISLNGRKLVATKYQQNNAYEKLYEIYTNVIREFRVY